MCSVFGFIARRRPDGRYCGWRRSTLASIIRANAARGPHAFGFAWVDAAGRLRMFKQTGRLVDDLAILGMTAGCRMLVGHLRYATHGDARNAANNHPHPVDGGWLVHNGVVRNHVRLAAVHDLRPSTECDSEVIGLLAETIDDYAGVPPRSRLWRMAAAADPPTTSRLRMPPPASPNAMRVRFEEIKRRREALTLAQEEAAVRAG